MRNEITRGMKDSIPICAGYLAVGFTFGIAAAAQGIDAFGAGLICVTNVTSAGQFAGLTVIAAGAPLVEMALTQLIINLRYLLMSTSLSQKFDPSIKWFEKCIMAFGVTDEIFGISSAVKGELNPFYNYGAMSLAIPAWASGAALGVIIGNALPEIVASALSVGIFGMFLAIIIPPAKQNKVIMGGVIASFVLSFVFSVLPVIKNNISSGMQVIILTVLISLILAFIFPVKEDEDAT